MKLPELIIKHIDIEPNKRILVTSDIHGHLSHFKKVLEEAQFSDDDILFIVGDIVEKGPQSLKTLRYVMGLCERGNVIPLIGNVDAWRLHMINKISDKSIQGFFDYICSLRNWCGTSFFDELTNELGFISQCPDDILNSKERVISHFEKEFDFLVSLPSIVETQNYIFVHGGLYDKDVESSRSRKLFEILKYGNFLNTEICFDKYVVAGHTPVSLYCDEIAKCNPIIDKEKKIISIDGGCGIKRYGQLNLLIIPEINCKIDDVYYISYDNMPMYCALTPQIESTNSVYIQWINNEIKIIERNDERTFVEQIKTNKRFWVPNSYIIDKTHCKDYTNYELPVNVGDMLSLVEKTQNGYLVKKNGVYGWYFGELEERI